MATTVNFLDVIKSNSFGAKTVTIDVDITNITLHVQFRKEQKQGKLLRDCTEGDGITVVNSSTFIIDDFIVDFQIGTIYYDCKFTYQSGKVKSYFGGTFNVIQNVTD